MDKELVKLAFRLGYQRGCQDLEKTAAGNPRSLAKILALTGAGVAVPAAAGVGYSYAKNKGKGDLDAANAKHKKELSETVGKWQEAYNQVVGENNVLKRLGRPNVREAISDYVKNHPFVTGGATAASALLLAILGRKYFKNWYGKEVTQAELNGTRDTLDRTFGGTPRLRVTP